MNGEYWASRIKQQKENFKKADELTQNISYQYNKAIKKIAEEIQIFFARFAENNKISFAEARQLLTNRQLKDFKMDVKEYIQKGKTLEYSKEWAHKLENASIRYRVSRLEALLFQMRQQVEQISSQENTEITETLKQIYSENYYKTIYQIQKDLGQSFSFAKLDTDKINKLLAMPWASDARNFSQRIWGEQRPKLIKTLETDFTQAIIRGDDLNKVIKKISNDFNVAKHRAANLVQTESAFFASQSSKDAFIESGVEKYQILAVLDDRTSEICQNMDGKIFPMSQYNPGITAPPFHNYCRTTTIPVVDDNFIKDETRAARYNISNRYFTVPANMTYKTWKNKYFDKKDFEKYNISTNAFLQKKLDYTFKGWEKFIPKRATIEHAKIIAGNGGIKPLRRKKELAEKYGGKPEEWSKCVGKIESDKYIFDVHWYELKNKQYAAKLKSITEKRESKKNKLKGEDNNET